MESSCFLAGAPFSGKVPGFTSWKKKHGSLSRPRSLSVPCGFDRQEVMLIDVAASDRRASSRLLASILVAGMSWE